ncbi:MAG: hypothetical protein R3E93_12710 [Thiothrix sp.]
MLRRETGFPSEWLPNEEHDSLPGAVWLPNGYGKLEPDTETYLQQPATPERRRQKASCWWCFFAWPIAGCRGMSWRSACVNTATPMCTGTRMVWMGWAEAGLPLSKVDPLPLEEAKAP